MITKKNQGQILVLQAVGLFLIVILFLHSFKVAQGLLTKQASQLSADLVALSGARVEAEVLQLIGSINYVMKEQTRIMIFTIAAPIIAAATIIGLPAVPYLTRIALEVVPRLIKSLKALSKLQHMIVRAYPALISVEIWRVARANSFSGASPVGIPRLPVEVKTEKFITDVLNVFNSKWVNYSPISPQKIYKKILKGEEPETKVQKIKKIKANKKATDSLSKIKRLRRLISPQKLFQAHYLNRHWIDDQINVVCWNEQGHIRLASAQVTHGELAHTRHALNHLQNNYISPKQARNQRQGFDVELVAFPDLIDQFPTLQKQLSQVNTYLKKIPLDIPLNNEHFKWIQH